MNDMLTSRQVAELLGIKPESVRRMRSRGDLPPEDAMAERTPLWNTDTITTWIAERPGRGWRKGMKEERS